MSITKQVPVRSPFDWQRYRQLAWFFGKVLLHFLWWDFILCQPILRHLRTAPAPRWQRIARAYCTLATKMGGVPIKLGQFLSLRIDLLPTEVTQTLAVLQDQGPTAPLTTIIATIETELAQPMGKLFAWFAPQPIASASLAQVHLAHLPSGEQVVVKVLRPGTDAQIEMDLNVIGRLVRVLNRFHQIRAHMDLDLVLAEFSMIIRRELDFVTEGRSAERFARDFASDPQIYIPKVYWAYSGAHILTLENVGYIKVTDLAALETAGIARPQVAKQLARAYLKQIFTTHFVHADPHPGNLFIKPLPAPAEARQRNFAPGEPVPYWPNRPFRIVLIDFGMTAEIPEQAQRWLHEFMIGLGLRDAHRIVQSYLTGDLLRPGVDLERMEAMTVELLEHFQETLVGLMPNMAQAETKQFLAEYGDLLAEYPFQVPVNLLFMYRALNIMGSQVKQLDPNFDLSAAAAPFATQLLWQTWQVEWQEWLQGVATLGQLLLTSPPQPELAFRQAQTVFKAPSPLQQLFSQSTRERQQQTKLEIQDRQTIKQLTKSIERLTWIMVFISSLLVGVLWQGGIAGYVIAGPPIAHLDYGVLLVMLVALLFIIRWLLRR